MTRKLSKKLCDTSLVNIVIFKDKIDESFTVVPVLWNNLQTKYKDLTTDVVYKGTMLSNYPDISIPNIKDYHLLEKYYGTQYWSYQYDEYIEKLSEVGCPLGLLMEKYLPIDILVNSIESTEKYVDRFEVTDEMQAEEAFHTSMF